MKTPPKDTPSLHTTNPLYLLYYQVHIKLRNFLSAVEDASRAIEISTYKDEDAAKRHALPAYY